MATLFASRNSQACHVPWTAKILTKVQQYLQDANLSSGKPIFKISILAHFVSHALFKIITPFQTHNVFISKANLILSNKVLKWTLHLHETRRYWPKCQKLPHHPKQILENFGIEGMCIRQSLPDTILLSRFLVAGNANIIGIVRTAFSENR